MPLSCGGKKSLGIEFSYRCERSLDFRADSSVAKSKQESGTSSFKTKQYDNMCDNFIIQVNMVYSPD